MKSYCVSKCNQQCKETIEKYQGMECFEDLKNSIGELLINSQKSCCEANQMTCESTSSSNLSSGAIAGIVVGSVVGGLLIIGLIIFIVIKCKSKNKPLQKHKNDSQIPLQNL